MDARTERNLQERLERGDIVEFAPCPFALPGREDTSFLFEQHVGGLAHKNICYNPHQHKVTGFMHRSAGQARNLSRILEQFAGAASRWLAELLPTYGACWRADRAGFRPEEEATRKVRLNARNDLLHIDAFPSRPTQGARILRLYVNIHPCEPRVWATSDSFSAILARFGAQAGLQADTLSLLAWKLGQGLVSIFAGQVSRRSEYDQFMLRLHHFLKNNEEYQEQARRKFRHFAPGTAWLAFTDGFSHGELRGQFALEHSFFVPARALALPNLAPAALFEKARTQPLHRHAA